MNSNISKRISDFSLPKRKCARVRATSVLPTPVGPRKRNEPMGRWGDFRPARERRMERARALIALSWEITRLCSSSSTRSSFCVSSSLIAVTRPPAHPSFDVTARHDAGRRFVQVIFLAQGAQVLALLALFIGIEARFFELVVRNRVLHPVNDKLDTLLDFGNLVRQRSLAQLDAR